MLYIICTPIGNLNDFSLRSINTLKEVDSIFAEDTRVAAKLLQHFDIQKKTQSFHEHNENEASEEIIELLKSGKTLALLSDAGAPLISDPGYPLIQRCIKESLSFTVLPGASALINAVILSGLPSDKFSFNGFLPKQHEAKRKIAIKLKNSNLTNIFFESAKRIVKTISVFSEVLNPDTQVAICREMTKEYESIYRGTIKEIMALIKSDEIPLLGEFVVLVYSGSSLDEVFDLDENFCLPFLEFLSPTEASRLIAKITSFSKQEVYKFLLRISK
ncbi:MAG: 16S rRNA (cytidine(1402)-2'-O)-methyltransferase [SAR86 cluster bacterium]|jgi:16S rRNA (cytidine1402-2'-O)-methyltransferase|nr:16S rRNA (cytidine(1402)-2'-O)-methyltransferase [SAR86 cluster bacterium]MDA8709423.1 16S rRNA (cytidine(1402)-2'-O)-methyltransferase [Gammaproteobacteria bacterium]MBL6822146.1 16S rRNA (cytidine(1402)-2'-O)-methyltransferase [SAR86 cluster bacterium]MDA9936014.1 16S rRNA (cytidine(1402)-2'-O)-methyltransferase [Gammaproteobacteria bacterium]MDA9965120.1 16S rRNA (cytidine(1402)-2'-O)-methyltransferase [Gammaproteobacteria bacterium]